MEILVPIDGSECSFRALRFARQLASRYDASLDAVHYVDGEADEKSEETEELIERAETILSEEEVDLVTDVRIAGYRYADRIGKDILDEIDEGGYDHVVMGHHGTGMIGRILLGSAAETVVRGAEIPVTVVS